MVLTHARKSLCSCVMHRWHDHAAQKSHRAWRPWWLCKFFEHLSVHAWLWNPEVPTRMLGDGNHNIPTFVYYKKFGKVNDYQWVEMGCGFFKATSLMLVGIRELGFLTTFWSRWLLLCFLGPVKLSDWELRPDMMLPKPKIIFRKLLDPGYWGRRVQTWKIEGLSLGSSDGGRSFPGVLRPGEN